MKIIFLHRLWPIYGGGETVTITLANELIKRNFEVHVAYFHDSNIVNQLPYIDKRIIKHKIENVKFDENSSDLFINKKEAQYISTSIIEIVNSENIDIIHNQWWPASFLKNIKIKTHTKVITCLHMDVDIRKVFPYNGCRKILLNIIYPFYRMIEKKKNLYRANKYYKESDRFIFLASSYKEKYVEMSGVSPHDVKLNFVYNPLVYNETIDKAECKEKENRVIFVGRLVENHKQISRILEAWKLIEETNKVEDWKLQIIGEGKDRIIYENYIKQHKLKNVSLEGFCNPLPYYKKAKIFLMTSAYEGFPMTLVEALQNCVVPIVMDSFSSINEIIQNGHNGIIVENGNIREFADALMNLMQNDNYRTVLYSKGVEDCKRFMVNNIVDKWIGIYDELKYE